MFNQRENRTSPTYKIRPFDNVFAQIEDGLRVNTRDIPLKECPECVGRKKYNTVDDALNHIQSIRIKKSKPIGHNKAKTHDDGGSAPFGVIGFAGWTR